MYTVFRLASDSEIFPYAASDVPFILLNADGTAAGWTNDMRSKLAMVQGNPNAVILAVWPGQYRSDVFSIDDKEVAAIGLGWGRSLDNWEAGMTSLERYNVAKGTTLVPPSYEDSYLDGRFPLGNWVRNQRQAHDQGTLETEQIARLERFGDWTWSASDAAWEENFARLGRYVAANNSAKVPPGYTDSGDGPPLGDWLIEQRRKWCQQLLVPEKASRLETLPDWKVAGTGLWDAFDFPENKEVTCEVTLSRSSSAWRLLINRAERNLKEITPGKSRAEILLSSLRGDETRDEALQWAKAELEREFIVVSSSGWESATLKTTATSRVKSVVVLRRDCPALSRLEGLSKKD